MTYPSTIDDISGPKWYLARLRKTAARRNRDRWAIVHLMLGGHSSAAAMAEPDGISADALRNRLRRHGYWLDRNVGEHGRTFRLFDRAYVELGLPPWFPRQSLKRYDRMLMLRAIKEILEPHGDSG